MDSFWRHVTSANWLADTGVPLVANIIAILVAVLLVQRQLRADQKLRQADRAVASLAGLLQSLEAACANLKSQEDRDYWARPYWPDQDSLRHAINGTVLTLDREFRHDLVRACAAIGAGWRAIAEARGNRDPAAHAQAASFSLDPLRGVLEEAKVELEGWDGVKKLRLPSSRRSASLDAPSDHWARRYG